MQWCNILQKQLSEVWKAESFLFYGISPFFKSSILPQNSLSTWLKKPGAGHCDVHSHYEWYKRSVWSICLERES